MDREPVLLHIEGAVATITLNRPDVFNSFNRAAALSLQGILARLAADEAVRCIVLTGTGRAFCAGQDLKEATDPAGPPIEVIVKEHYNPIIMALRGIEKPVIAAVNGVAAGAGANIALACDLVVASASASFLQAFSKIALIPDSGGTYFLPRIVGMQRATAMAFLGEKVSAEEAERIGMIYRCVEDENFHETIKALAAKLASMPTRALGMTKRAFNASWGHSLEQQLALECDLQKAASAGADYAEGVQAFLEKRKAEFKGK